MYKYAFLLALLSFLLAAGCARSPRDWQEHDVASVPYNEHSLSNFRLAKQYMAEGRYELARYRLQQAYNSARTKPEQMMIQRELENCNRLVQAAR
ncbi:hypothetical protein [Megalodesulfovibrio paquesii]